MATDTHATTQPATSEEEPFRTLRPGRAGTTLDYDMLDVKHVLLAQLLSRHIEAFRDSTLYSAMFGTLTMPFGSRSELCSPFTPLVSTDLRLTLFIRRAGATGTLAYRA